MQLKPITKMLIIMYGMLLGGNAIFAHAFSRDVRKDKLFKQHKETEDLDWSVIINKMKSYTRTEQGANELCVILDPTSDMDTVKTRQNIIHNLLTQPKQLEYICNLIDDIKDDIRNDKISEDFSYGNDWCHWSSDKFSLSLPLTYAARNLCVYAAGAISIAYSGKSLMNTEYNCGHITWQDGVWSCLSSVFNDMKAAAMNLTTISTQCGYIVNRWHSDSSKIEVLERYKKAVNTARKIDNTINGIIDGDSSTLEEKCNSLNSMLRDYFNENITYNWFPLYQGTIANTVYSHLCNAKNRATIEYGIFSIIGYYDALAACAQFIRKHHNNDATFTCVTFDENNRENAYINLQDFWSPVINPVQVVTNNIEIDGKNIFISGPNGTGKTATMKGVGHCIMLGQSIGYAPAKAAQMTPFSRIFTYIDVKQNFAEGKSRFQAEVDRIDTIGKNVSDCQGRSLFLADEPLSGTCPQTADDLVTGISEKIGNDATTILASHFEGPTKLENTSSWKNYYMLNQEEHDSTFTLTRKLQPGIDWWFNNPEKRLQYIHWLAYGTTAMRSQSALLSNVIKTLIDEVQHK